MNTQEILSQNWTKTKKAKALYDLGYTRRQVADLICNGNYGFAYNIWKKWNETHEPTSVAQVLEYLTDFAFNRKFGVEMEFYNVTQTSLKSKMNESGLEYRFEGYNHTTRAHWKFVTDSSISGTNGRELVSPPLQGDNGLQQLRKACKALRLSKAKINQSCGLHVHIDANDYTLENFKLLILNWLKLENEIDKIMPNSRRESNNRFCKTNNKPNIKQKIRNAQSLNQISNIFGTRYVKMNLESYQRHGTIEFRHHSGSCNYTKIKNWILICSRLVEASKQGIKVENINQILNDDLQEYFEERQLDFV